MPVLGVVASGLIESRERKEQRHADHSHRRDARALLRPPARLSRQRSIRHGPTPVAPRTRSGETTMHPLLQWQLAAQRRDGLLAEAQRRRLVRSAAAPPESEGLSFLGPPTPPAVADPPAIA